MRFFLVAMMAVALLAADTAAAPQAPPLRSFEATATPRRIETYLPPAGRAGNRDLLLWTIHDRHGRAFGAASLDCNWTRSLGRQCVGVFRLARGSFAVSGSGQTRSFGEFLITGGTGDYETSHGSLTFNATSRGKLVLHGFLS